MTPHEGRDAVVNLVVDTTEHLDVGTWQANHGAAAPQNCTMKNEGEGASYQFSLWADQGTSFDEDIQRVADYWESLGMETRSVDHGQYPVLYGTGGPVFRASFDTNGPGNSYRIGAVSPCTPGDAGALKREANEQRKDGERFPGDEYVPEENIDEAYKN